MAQKEWNDYKRFPIIISSHACLVIHVFERYDKFEDIWMDDFEPKMHDNIAVFKRAAEQFINQLEGQYCDMFLEELIAICQSKLKKK